MKLHYKVEYFEDSTKNYNIAQEIKELLSPEWIYEELNPDYIFILGGDGTFLHAFAKYSNKKVKLVAINTGTLGFYTIGVWNSIDKDLLKKQLLDEHNFFSPLVLKTRCLDANNKCIKTILSLNDLVVCSSMTLKASLIINKHQEFSNFIGSGFIACTPTGSTGINRSNFGPIFFSSLNAYCLSFILPINNKKLNSLSNSFLFTKKEEISIKLLNSEIKWDLVHDGLSVESNIQKNIKILNIKAINAKCKMMFSYETEIQLQRLKNFF